MRKCGWNFDILFADLRCCVNEMERTEDSNDLDLNSNEAILAKSISDLCQRYVHEYARLMDNPDNPDNT